jgi:hypothetical protein
MLGALTGSGVGWVLPHSVVEPVTTSRETPIHVPSGIVITMTERVSQNSTRIILSITEMTCHETGVLCINTIEITGRCTICRLPVPHDTVRIDEGLLEEERRWHIVVDTTPLNTRHSNHVWEVQAGRRARGEVDVSAVSLDMRHLVSDCLTSSRLYGTCTSVLIEVLRDGLTGAEYDVGYLISSV